MANQILSHGNSNDKDENEKKEKNNKAEENKKEKIDKKSEKSKTEFCKKLYLDKQTMDEIVHINSQLEEIVSLMGIPIANQSDSVKDYLICLASGLRQYICIKAQAYSYRSIKASEIYIHPGSSWFRTRPEFILAGEIVQTTKMYARSVSPLKADWIKSISPELLSALLSPVKSEKKVERASPFRFHYSTARGAPFSGGTQRGSNATPLRVPAYRSRLA